MVSNEETEVNELEPEVDGQAGCAMSSTDFKNGLLRSEDDSRGRLDRMFVGDDS